MQQIMELLGHVADEFLSETDAHRDAEKLRQAVLLLILQDRRERLVDVQNSTMSSDPPRDRNEEAILKDMEMIIASGQGKPEDDESYRWYRIARVFHQQLVRLRNYVFWLEQETGQQEAYLKGCAQGRTDRIKAILAGEPTSSP
jgi:hypothetical protein